MGLGLGFGLKMRKPKKFRTLKELYHVTAPLHNSKSTPVLEWSCTFRGPVDETEGSDQMNMGLCGSEGQLGTSFPRGKFNESEETGACSVCEVPCSCRVHLSRVASPMETKDGIKDEASSGKEASRCSCGDANVVWRSKSGSFNHKHHSCSETSNPLSPCSSSHNSSSEKADGKSVPGGSDISEVIEMPLKVTSCKVIAGNRDLSKPSNFHGDRVIMDQHNKQKELELLCDNVSCVSRADGTDVIHDDHSADASRNPLSCSSASVNSFPADLKDSGIQYVSHCLVGGHSEELEVDCRERRIECIEGSIQGFSDHPKILEASEISSLKTFYPSACAPKGKSLECTEEQSELTLTRDMSVSVGYQMHSLHSSSESLEPVAEIENLELSGAEALNCSEKVHSGDSSLVLVEPKTLQSLPSQPDINKDRAIDQEIDVKVCDICGDEGQRHRLAICRKCNDGAEHIYCMRVKLDKVPEGYWMCEGCKLKDDEENPSKSKFDKSSTKLPLNKEKHNCEGSRALKLNNHLPSGVKHSTDEKSRTSRIGSTSHCTAKRSGINLQGGSMKKRRIHETPVGSSGMRPCQATALRQDFQCKSSDKGTTKVIGRNISLDDHSSRIFKPVGGTLLPHSSSVKNLEKGKINNTREVTSLGGNIACTNSGKSILHKSHTIKSKPQNFEGHLYKSKSFNGVSSKVEVQLPVQGGPHRPKITKNAATSDSKNVGDPRRMQKSKSFSNASSHRFNVCHAKLKVLSPRLTRCDDVEKLKHTKERSYSQSVHTSKFNVRSVHTSKFNERVSGSGVSPLTSDRKLLSNGACTSLHTVVSKSLDTRTSNCPGDSTDSSGQRNHFVETCSKFSNKGEELVACDGRQNTEHSTAEHMTNASFPSHGRLEKDLPKVAVDVVIPDKGVVPELDYIWRGGFELERSGRLASSYDGIQAHLSICASPKVLEVVDKIPYKIMLEEVPRSSTWPTQFLLKPVTENNIALYFFAKDVESYERNYRSLLECMTENDLALKGNLDGIELLIFSSSLLPQESQRWNRLLFLWGLFRVRSGHVPNPPAKAFAPCSEPMPNSEEKTSPPMPNSDKKTSTPKSEISTSQDKTSNPSLNLFSPKKCVLNSQHISNLRRKVSTPKSEHMSYPSENVSDPDPNTAIPNRISIPAISGCQDLHTSSQLIGSLCSPNTSHNVQISNCINSLPVAPVSPGSVLEICEPIVTTTEQKIVGLPAKRSQEPSVASSIQDGQLSGDVLPFKATPQRDSKRRLEIDLNSCCEEQIIDSAVVYENQEPKRTKNCFNAVPESSIESDGAKLRINDIVPGFSAEDQNITEKKYGNWQVVGAKGEDKMELAIPNLELSLCSETKRAGIDLELSLGGEEVAVGVEADMCALTCPFGMTVRDNEQASYQVTSEGKKSVSLFGCCLNV